MKAVLLQRQMQCIAGTFFWIDHSYVLVLVVIKIFGQGEGIASADPRCLRAHNGYNFIYVEMRRLQVVEAFGKSHITGFTILVSACCVATKWPLWGNPFIVQ